MTRDFANELLYLWKVGAEIYPAHVITRALYVTGDLDGPHLEADARLVHVPRLPAWVEGAGLALTKQLAKDHPSVYWRLPDLLTEAMQRSAADGK